MTVAQQHLCRAKMEGDFTRQVDGSGKSASWDVKVFVDQLPSN
jgi:hypothetical protein